MHACQSFDNEAFGYFRSEDISILICHHASHPSLAIYAPYVQMEFPIPIFFTPPTAGWVLGQPLWASNRPLRTDLCQSNKPFPAAKCITIIHCLFKMTCITLTLPAWTEYKSVVSQLKGTCSCLDVYRICSIGLSLALVGNPLLLAWRRSLVSITLWISSTSTPGTKLWPCTLMIHLVNWTA